jgi:RHS repeat-associated protein
MTPWHRCANLYDGESLTETVNTSGNTLARYTHGQDIDEPLAMILATTPGYYEVDGLGSVTSLTASNGSVAQSNFYNAFGEIVNQTGTSTNLFRYTSRDFDADTSLYCYRARYYDPALRRFLSEGPLEFNVGRNFYTYVANNPFLEDHLRPRIGVSSAVAARTGSKYSRKNAILPPAARRNTT